MNRYLSLTLVTIGLVLAAIGVGRADDATLLPNAVQWFMDNNGKSLATGKVYFYEPNTLTPKTVWKDAGKSTSWTQPITLNATGRPANPIYGDGSYRQIVKDSSNNTIWDFNTASTGGGSSGGGGTATGDGDLVGTVKPWAGVLAPNQYMFAYGQAVSRTTYSALFTAITQTQAIICTNGLNVLSGIGDTTQLPIGGFVEASCIPPGTYITAKAPNSVTLSANASVSTAVNATFFFFGNGDGSTTFNLPDLRGRVIPGRNNMGGTASSAMSSTNYLTNPNAMGALGGSDSHALLISEIPSGIHSANTGTIAVSATTSASDYGRSPGGSNNSVQNSGTAFGSSNSWAFQAVNVTGTLAIGAVAVSSNNTGGVAASATVATGGSGYTNGNQIVTISGGTCSIQPQLNVGVSGNTVVLVNAIETAGDCTVTPSNPVSVTGGGGTGATFNVSYNARGTSLVQPSYTLNFIIKVTPDSNSPTASGVTSLGGMTGDIACGTGLICTGNTVSIVSGGTLVVSSTGISGGTTGRILYDNLGVLGEYAISGTGNVAMTTSPSFTTPSLGAATATSLAASGEIDTATHLYVGSGSSPASTHGILITKTLPAGTDVAGIQNSFTIGAGASADVAGMFVAPSVANGGTVTDLYGVRAESVVLNGSATLSIYKAFRVDDLTSLTVGSSKWAFYAEGSGAGGAARFGNTTINADGAGAMTVGTGAASANTTVVINGGGSGNGAGGSFSLQTGGTNFAFVGNHSAIFGGTFATDTVMTSASSKKIELSPGLTGSAFSQSVTTTLFPSGGVGIGTATDPGAGGLLATGIVKSNSKTAGVGYATGAGCSVTQGSSRTTAVTCNGVSGQITLVSAAGSATAACFTVNNTSIAANDSIVISQLTGTDAYNAFAATITANTSFRFCQSDLSGSTVEQPVFQFNVIKGVAS